ncbi:MAG: serine hydrolase [Bacteroidetes bacterium]|nr:serine hydrolase [Bacteroidota bacterium]
MRAINFKFIFTILLCSSVDFLFAQEIYFPDSIWLTKKPTELKMSTQILDSAVRFAIRNETKTDYDLRIAVLKSFVNEPGYKILGPMKQRGKPAGVILRKGYIVAQWGDVKRVDMDFSVTKSYLSTVAGLAYDSRLIKSVDDRVIDYVEEKFDGDHNSKITWRHLLTQSSDWSGCLFDLCDWADRPPKQGNIDDWKNRKLLEPGTSFEYNDVRVNLMAYSLLQVWRKPLPVVLKEKIMDPIGASSTWRWHGYENSYVNLDGSMMQSVSGGGHHGGGLFINTLDQARFGLLFLRKGKWKNHQLISERWVNASHQPSAANKSYGFMWWTNQENELGNISKDIYYANGFGGNFIVIDNEHDLVIAVRWLDPQKLGDLVQLIISSVDKNK